MPLEDVAIFWDYENCAAAAQYTGYEIVKKIRYVAHCFGTIKLFKAYLELSDSAAFSKSLVLRSELQCSGVSLTDCPHNGRKDVADKMILVDMLAYAIDNPPPSTIILISGDRDFAYSVSVLRLRRYRVVIVSLPAVHTSLKTQASIFLDWNNDVLGVDVVDNCRSPHDGLVPQEDYRSTSVLHFQRERSNKDLTSFLPRAGRSNGEKFDIDIMDHLHYKGNGTAPNYEPLDPRVSRGDISKETFSYPRPATPTSHNSPPMTGSRSPWQTESVSATLLADETSSTPTVVSKPSPAEDQAESTVEGSLYTPETQSTAQKTPLAGNTFPAPILTSQGLSAAPNQQDLSTLGTTPNAVPTSSSSNQPQIPSTQLNPAIELLPTHNSNTTSASNPLTQQSQPKVVPPQFSLLVQRLQSHRSKGFSRPFRSGVAIELASKDNMVYRRAGTERFGQYVALAEKAGIIELGGKEGGAWIALRPEWYNAKIG